MRSLLSREAAVSGVSALGGERFIFEDDVVDRDTGALPAVEKIAGVEVGYLVENFPMVV